MISKKKIISALLLISLYACSKEVASMYTGFQQPDNFPAPSYRLADNGITEGGFMLGRKLFYEPLLSKDNSVSCGSCHIQSAAFTHHGHDISHGINDRQGSRNAQPIMNLAWESTFMWDGGVPDLDLQPIVPITSHVEMGETMENVLNKLRAHKDYPSLFKKAFGKQEITTATTMKALSQFMLMCISSQSKYDSVMRKEGAAFSEQERTGYAVFQQKCGSCHKEPLFTDNSFRNNGLPAGPNNDEGRYSVTLDPADRYRFKVPGLRNLAYTAPYMHDGRLRTLDAVLTHYSEEVRPAPTLDVELLRNDKPGIPLSEAERSGLLAFLQTLNDKKFITDKRLSEQ